jgi:hypothetical protein
MPRKRALKPEPEPVIPELAAPEASENSRLYRAKAFPFAGEGSTYCFPLREHLVAPTILRGESAIGALLALPAGNVYGLTYGQRSHLFYFHPGFGVADVGIVSEQPVQGGALLDAGNNTLLGGWFGESGGGMFRHDVSVELGQGMEQFRGAKSAIEPLALPKGVGGIAALVGPDEEGIAYGLATPEGSLLRLECASGKIEVLARVAAAAPVLVMLPGGGLLGAFAEGRLWQWSPWYTNGLAALDAHAPCQQGKRYVAGVQSMIVADSGLVYGGTSTDGYLFSYDTYVGELTNLGKPNRQSNIRALAEGHDGRIFGLVEEPEGMAHLFSFDPATRSFTDLGLLGSAFPEYWMAHSLGAMVVGPNGELFIGETDDISHLFIYYPRISQRRLMEWPEEP